MVITFLFTSNATRIVMDVSLLKQITRGRLLANKATLLTRQASSDLLDRAKQFGIKIFYIDGEF